MSIALVLELAGAMLLLFAYFGLQAEMWGDIDLPFLILNAVGAGLLAVVGWAGWRVGFAVLNSVWCLVAVRAVLGFVMERRAGRQNR